MANSRVERNHSHKLESGIQDYSDVLSFRCIGLRLHKIVISWLLKCMEFVLPKGYHVLLRAQPEEVHDKGGAIPYTSKAMA